MAGGQVIDRLFVQKQFGRHHARMGVEPFLHNAVMEKIRDRQQSHALVVGHPAAHKFELVAPFSIARGGEISRLIESVGPNQPS